MKKLAWYTWALAALTVLIAFDGFGLEFWPMSTTVACYDPDSGLMAQARQRIIVDGVLKTCQLDGTWKTSVDSNPKILFDPDKACLDTRSTFFCGEWGGDIYSSLTSYACYEDAYKTKKCNGTWTDCSKYSIHDEAWTQCYEFIEDVCEVQRSGDRYTNGVGYGVRFYDGGENICQGGQEYVCSPKYVLQTAGWEPTGKSCGFEAECVSASDCVNDAIDWVGERDCVNNKCVYEEHTPDPPEPPVDNSKEAYLWGAGLATLGSLFIPRRQI